MPSVIGADGACKAPYDTSAKNIAAFSQQQMFTNGFHEPIHKEVVKQTFASFQAVYQAALDFEVIQQDNRTAKPVMVATINKAPASTSEYQDD
jgi:hypothetical protein